MAPMSEPQLFAGIPVADYKASSAWYERLFGGPPDFRPHDTEAVWRASERGWVYVVADPGRAGHALVTVLVDDLDAHLAEIAERGIAAPAIETIPNAARKATFVDPDGNAITFGETAG